MVMQASRLDVIFAIFIIVPCIYLFNVVEDINGVCWSPWATITRYCGRDCLNNRNLFLTVIEAEKSSMHISDNLVPAEDPLPGLQTPIFCPCPHMREKEL